MIIMIITYIIIVLKASGGDLGTPRAADSACQTKILHVVIAV